jgi:hypothetical protein
MNLLEVRDGDGDGKINDGKSSEGPAPPKQAKKRVSQSRASKKVSQTAPAQQSQSDQNKQSEEHFYKNKQVLGAIAEKTLGLETTETRNSDRLDFAETSVWSMRKAGKEAFVAGAGRPPNTKEQLAIDAVLKKEFDRDSLDTKNNSSDFSEIHVKSARIALGAIHKQGASSGSSSGAKKPKDAQTKLSQADRIARAERRSTRYARMANKAYSRGQGYVDASKQVGGPMSDRLRARGDELVQSSRRLMGKSNTVKKAIAKVSDPSQSPSSSKKIPSSLTQADKITRAQRRADRYQKKGMRMEDKGNTMVQSAGSNDKQASKGYELIRAGNRLTGKSQTVRKAIDKVKSNAQK